MNCIQGATLLWCLIMTTTVGGALFRRGIDENFVERSIPYDGSTRWFLEYRPKSPAPDNAALVIVLHGAGGSMYTLFKRNRVATRPWIDVCEENGFVLLAPNGISERTGDTKGNSQLWNDYNGYGNNTIDDVGFLAALVNWAVTVRGGVDRNRVYLAGISNGGMMTYRALIETVPPVYAAAAAFIANLPAMELLAPNWSTPIFIMNGNKDKVVKWEGGEIGNDDGEVRSALATRDYWIQVNGADKDKVQRSNLPNLQRLDRCRISSEFYPASLDANVTSAPVHFYTLVGGGHTVPFTGIRPVFRLVAGLDCRDANSAAFAWDFMTRYTL